MIRLVLLVLALAATSSAQFSRFRFGSRRDSFEDDSDERFFGSNRNFARRDFDDSREDILGSNRNFIRRDFDNSISRESNERTFGRNRNFRNRNFDDSFEDNFSNRRRGPFGRRRFDDSDEGFFSRSNFINRNTGRTRQTVGQNFGTTQTAGSPNFFTRQSFGTSRNRNFLHDSLEDVIEDLFDDDLDDRLRAQHALSHFQSPGTGSISTRRTNNGFRFGATSPQSNNFGRTGTRSNRVSNNRNANTGAFAFRTSFGQNNNQVGSSRRTSNQGSSFKTNPAGQNQFTKQPSRFSTNSIRNQRPSKPSSSSSIFKSKTKKTQARTPKIFGNTGFNWPGGNGYYVSMRTGTGKPTTYFIKFDD